MADLITVSAADSIPDGRVVLWERDAAHPGGECYLTGGMRDVAVAGTAAVLHRLADGALARTSDGASREDESVSRRSRRKPADGDDASEVDGE